MSAFDVIPAIDLQGGRCVRLVRGDLDDATVYGDDPAAMARRWAAAGVKRLHVVDLDGAAAGRPVATDAVRAIVAAVPGLAVQLGGGLRDAATVEAALALGVARVILGTAAARDPALLASLVRAHPGRVVLGLDARDGLVAVDAWRSTTGEPAPSAARRLVGAAGPGLGAIVFTDVSRDGVLAGPALDSTVALAEAVAPVPVIASGGVTTLDDVRALAAASARGVCGAIVGRAIYEGHLDLAAAVRATA